MPPESVSKILEAIARLDERLKAAVDVMEAEAKKGQDHETRIRGLERDRWLLTGGCVVLQVLIAFVLRSGVSIAH